jgi:hypothetical protein|uniref:Uncharacterized protein n=1 Tax=viral metagenome TaxID=1070528 RepID=A0A6C0E1H9_9ZZZZ
MTLFISNDNQTLLYEMIHRDRAIHTAFGSQSEPKNAWFRSVIRDFYSRISPNITREELKAVNRQVLAYMIRTLKERAPLATNIPVTYNTLKREHTPDYDTIQNQYNAMFDAPKPTSVDFGEKVEDTAITNMEELIEHHKKQREIELQEYRPAVNHEIEDTTRIKILQDLPEEEVRATAIPEKKVQFTIPTEYTHLATEIEIIKTKIERVNDTLLNLVELLTRGSSTNS